MNTIEDPIPFDHGLIVVLDMLGFKEFIQTNTLENIISEYASIITGAFLNSKVFKESFEFMICSDTIAIRLVHQNDDAFYTLMTALQSILNRYFFELSSQDRNPFPIRGAISYGDYLWHKGVLQAQTILGRPILAENINIIVGKAIFDAQINKSNQELIGISIDIVTLNKITQLFPVAYERLIEEGILIPYEIPCKRGKFNDSFMLNPFQTPFWFEEMFNAFIEKSISIFKNNMVDIHIKRSYYNTLIFFNYINKIKFMHKNGIYTEINKEKYYDATVLYRKKRLLISLRKFCFNVFKIRW
jgi:hypothetical protein